MNELEVMLAEYRDMYTELEPAINQLKALEKDIKEHCKETGEIATIDGAQVKTRSGYTRVNWDKKALEGYAAVRPEILQFKSEKQVSPTVTIKIGG